MVNLVKYDAACQALAAARSTDEVREVRDSAEAMRAYARQAKNKAMETDAAEIRIRAERRLGEIIKAQKETVGLATGGQVGGRTKVDGTREEPSNRPPTLAEAGIDKKLSSRAQKLADIPEAEFETHLTDWRADIEQANERVTVNLTRAAEQARRDDDFSAQPMQWPAGKYPIIYADPPWRYEHPPMGGSNRSIENHYPTMTLEEICALPVQTIAADDCTLFLWATAPKLAECIQVIEAWGFDYRTCLVWVKDKIGMGYYARNRHELLLVARKGDMSPPKPPNRFDSVIEAARGEHSAKPSIVYDMLETMYPGLPKIELFSRSLREGWQAWGYEAG